MKKTRKTHGYVTLPQLAVVLGVPTAQLRTLAKAGKIPLAHREKEGKVRFRVEQADLRKLLLGNAVATTVTPVVEEVAGLFTVKAAAKQLGVTAQAIYFALSKGLLVGRKIGGTIYLDQKSLDRYLVQKERNKEERLLKMNIANVKRKLERLQAARQALAGQLRDGAAATGFDGLVH